MQRKEQEQQNLAVRTFLTSQFTVRCDSPVYRYIKMALIEEESLLVCLLMSCKYNPAQNEGLVLLLYVPTFC